MKQNFVNMTDEELYTELGSSKKKVSKQAFDELYSRYSVNVFAYCRKILNSEDAARDVFQETFTRVFQTAKKNKVMTNFAGFIITIARNLCLNEKSKKKRVSVSLDDINLPSYDTSYGNKQLEELLETALEDLPEEYREALILKEFMNMSYKQIAEILSTTLPVVRIRIYRAKNKLKELLSPYYNETENILE
ncbi:RNA polymerase sigma factor [Candidatus Kapabacteria bacterium]|nr:RNA polymerase sigma factor [Candidatus Kapabacteria bacterium]